MVGGGEPVQIHAGENHPTPWWALLTSESGVSLDKPAGTNGPPRSEEVIGLSRFLLLSPSLIVRDPQGSMLSLLCGLLHTCIVAGFRLVAWWLRVWTLEPDGPGFEF